MTDRELMQQALEALTQANQCIFISAKLPFPPALNATSEAIKALRARLANEFNPDWDAMAVMVEEQQQMAKRIEELKERLLQVELNPSAARLAQPDLITHADVEQLARIEKLVEDVDPYTAPPQREWIGLTDEEIQQIQISASSKLSAIYITEAQLKGKNA